MKGYSLALVTAQFLLIALILSPVSHLPGSSLSALFGMSLIICAACLAFWALAAMKPSNFSVLPEPATQSRLVQSGPYQLIRHPMYTAVIAGCLGAAICHASTIKWFWLFCLCIVLSAKIRREERLLNDRFENYQAYSQHTYSVIPYIL